jgi:hypothetical protein
MSHDLMPTLFPATFNLGLLSKQAAELLAFSLFKMLWPPQELSQGGPLAQVIATLASGRQRPATMPPSASTWALSLKSPWKSQSHATFCDDFLQDFALSSANPCALPPLPPAFHDPQPLMAMAAPTRIPLEAQSPNLQQGLRYWNLGYELFYLRHNRAPLPSDRPDLPHIAAEIPAITGFALAHGPGLYAFETASGTHELTLRIDRAPLDGPNPEPPYRYGRVLPIRDQDTHLLVFGIPPDAHVALAMAEQARNPVLFF